MIVSIFLVEGGKRAAVRLLLLFLVTVMAFLTTQQLKNPPVMQEMQVRALSRKDPLEKGKATQSSILAWRISWTV